MRKVYTLGQELAHKQILMAAASYNLKKLMNAMFFKKADSAVCAVANTAKNAMTFLCYAINAAISKNISNY